MELLQLLRQAVERGASDVLLIAGLPVAYKINGVILREGERLGPADTAGLLEGLYRLAGERDMALLLQTGDDDFSFAVPGLSRFRVNALKQRGSLGAVVRVVSFALPDRTALGIPDNVMAFAEYSRGLVLFTGPAGSGKTTTLACIVDAVNTTRNAHVITIEDPIEYLHQHKKSVVTQRELSTDTRSYDAALRAALREAPDIILLGEMRDAETIKAAVTAAETGHLVISTLHTIGAANTIDRIVDSFPAGAAGADPYPDRAGAGGVWCSQDAGAPAVDGGGLVPGVRSDDGKQRRAQSDPGIQGPPAGQRHRPERGPGNDHPGSEHPEAGPGRTDRPGRGPALLYEP